MKSFKFKKEKALVTMQVLLTDYGGQVDLHKLFKTIYFAEQKHLSIYGRPIIGDKYIAMKDGPVPSNCYDILKLLRGDYSLLPQDSSTKKFQELFRVEKGHFLMFNQELTVNKSILSESELECIKKSYTENKDLSFNILSKKSHAEAWKKADRNNELSILEIAREGGASEEFLEYIKINIENENLVF